MLEGLVAWVLNNYLGKYVENLNTDQLSIALLSGKVELENLPLRRNALRQLGLPIDIKSGFIGKVKLQIPVRQIRSAPWVIVVEQLYVVASPLPIDEWDAESEALAAQELKLQALDNIEAKWRLQTEAKEANSTYYASSYSSWLSFGSGIVSEIIENLQLTIQDVHIRYEDRISIPGKALAVGLTMEVLSAQSCDSNWSPCFLHTNKADESFKLLEMQKFAMYWEDVDEDNLFSNLSLGDLAIAMAQNQTNKRIRNYILAPVSAQAHVKQNRSEQPLRSGNTPRLVCDLLLDDVPLTLIDWQYDQIVKCVRALDTIDRLRSYRLYKPLSCVKENPRAWWIYAISSFFPGGQPSICRTKQTWGDCLLKAKQNVKYVKLYTKILTMLNIVLTMDEKAFKDEVEKNRDYKELKILRKVAMESVPIPNNGTPATDSAGRSILISWFPQWIGWYSQPTGTESSSPEASQLEGEILQVLTDSAENNTLLKRDDIFGRFNFCLKRGSLNLCASQESPSESASMLVLEFKNLSVSILSKPRTSSYTVELSLDSLYLKDKITLNTLFPILMGPPGVDRTERPFSGRCQSPNSRAPVEQSDESVEHLFYLAYEKKPQNSSCDIRLCIRSKCLDIVYQPNAVSWLTDFLCLPLQRDMAQMKIEAMKNRTKKELIKNWEQMLDGRVTRSTWELELDISAPQFIFVEQFTDSNSVMAVIDFGKLQLFSNPSSGEDISNSVTFTAKNTEDDETFLTPCSTPPASEASGSDENLSSLDYRPFAKSTPEVTEKSLHCKLYDRYCVEMIDLQILIGKVKDNWRFAQSKGSSTLHIIDKFNICLQIEKRIVHTSDPLYPSLIINTNVPKLVSHLNESKIRAARTLAQIITTTGVPSPFMSEVSMETVSEADQNDESTSLDTSIEMSRLLMIQFSIDHLSLEVQSRSRCIAELQVSGVNVSFTKRPYDISITLTVHSLLLVDALQTFGPDFELLVASHKHVGMDSMSGSIRDSEPASPNNPASPDMSATKLYITSPLALTQALKNLRTSPVNSPRSPAVIDNDVLITVEIVIITGQEAVHFANIQFNNIDIIANQETIVELLGFAQRVFPKAPKSANVSLPRAVPSSVRESSDNLISDDLPKFNSTELTFNFHRLNVLLLRGVMRDGVLHGKKICTATMSDAKIEATIGNNFEIEGCLGGLQVLDLTPEGRMHQRIISVGRDPLHDSQVLYRSLMQDDGSALNFRIFRRLESVSDKDDATVSVRMASLWYTHSPHLIMELHSWATEFKHYLSNLAQSIRSAATDMALGFVHARAEALAQSLYMNARLSSSIYGSTQSFSEPASPRKRRRSSSLDPSGYSSITNGTTPQSPNDEDRFVLNLKLNVELESPVVVLPETSSSPKVFVAHLGKIRITNRNESEPHASDEVNNEYAEFYTEQYVVDVKDMNLFSVDTTNRRQSLPIITKPEIMYNCKSSAKPILHDTIVQLKIKREVHRSLSVCRSCEFDLLDEDDALDGSLVKTENFEITGSVVNGLKVSLTRAQYKQLLNTLQWLTASRVPDTLQNEAKDSTRAAGKLSDIMEEDTGVTTLNMDPHVRAKMFPSVHTTKATSSRKVIPLKMLFDIPLFTIELRGDTPNGEQSLVDLSFRDFVFNYDKCHLYETSIQMSLRSVIMEDLLKPPNTRQRIMMVSSSDADIPQSSYCLSRSLPDIPMGPYLGSAMNASLPDHLYFESGMRNPLTKSRSRTFNRPCPNTPPPSPSQRRLRPEGNLVLISMLLVDPEAPKFETTYKSVERSTSVDFNCLDLVVSVESWVIVLDFFSASPSKSMNRPAYSTEMKEQRPFEGIKENKENSTETTININSLTVVLVKPDYDVAKANISNLDISIKTKDSFKQVQGKLGSMSLLDLTLHGQLYRERFSSSGKNALQFEYLRDTSSQSLCVDAQLSLTMCSVTYVHTKRFISEIQAFFSHFSQLQTLMTSIRAATSGQMLRDEPLKILLFLKADSPMILLPVSSKSPDLLIIDLRQMLIRNEFKLLDATADTKQCLIDAMTIELGDMDLYAGVKENDLNSMKSKEYSSNDYIRLSGSNVTRNGSSLLMNKIQWTLQVERNLSANVCHIAPDLSIYGQLSTLNCSLDLSQYRLIRGLLAFNLGEDTEKLLPSVASPPVNTDISSRDIWILSSLKLDLQNVTMCLRVDSATPPLTCINFIKSRLTVETFSNLSQDVDLISHEILISDSRFDDVRTEERSNVFKNVVQPIKCAKQDDLIQVEVHSRKRQNHFKYTILVNSMRLMMIFDWWEAIQDFIFQKIENVSTSPSHQVTANVSKKVDDVTFELKLNITDSEVVLIEDMSRWNSNAVILKNSTVVTFKPRSIEKPLSCSLNNCEMFSCILGMEDDTALSIIDPVTLSVDVNKDNILEAQLHVLTVRLSYHDICMFLQMLNSLPKQLFAAKNGQSSEVVSPKGPIQMLTALGFELEDCELALEHCNHNVDDSALWLTQNAGFSQHEEKKNQDQLLIKGIEVKARCISLCIIDDCGDSDVPLLEVTSSQLNVFQALPLPGESNINCWKGNLECILASDYYNRTLSGWEPFIEPWKCGISWSKSLTNNLQTNRLNLKVDSAVRLNVNVTATLLKLYKHVKETWTTDYYKSLEASKSNTQVYRQRSPFVPFALKNETGSELQFTTLITDLATHNTTSQGDFGNHVWEPVASGQVVPFSFKNRGKLRHHDSHTMKLHQLCVKVDGWRQLTPVTVDKVGTYFRVAAPQLRHRTQVDMPSGRVMFDITLEGSARKLITVRSALLITNTLEETIEVKLESQLPHDALTIWTASKSFYIENGETFPVPLDHVFSLISLRPRGTNQAYTYCSPLLTWFQMPHNMESVHELRTCHTHKGHRYRFCTKLAREFTTEKYAFGGLLPSHRIILFPSVVISNLLPVELNYEICGNRGGILAGSTSKLTNVDLDDTVEVEVTIENFRSNSKLIIPVGCTMDIKCRIHLEDEQGRKLLLLAVVSPNNTAKLKITVSCPYWIINKTGLPLVFRQTGTSYESAGQFQEHEIARMVSPLLFSFSDQEASLTINMRVGNYVIKDGSPQWSSNFHVQKGIQVMKLHVTMQNYKPDTIFIVGIEVRSGRGKYRSTTIVTISPRYQLYNQTSFKLAFTQSYLVKNMADPKLQKNCLKVIPNSHIPFHWPRMDKEQFLSVSIEDVPDCCWSGGLHLEAAKSSHVNIRDINGKMYFLRLEVLLQGATFFVIFADADTLPPPIRVDNFSEVSVTFAQTSCKELMHSTARAHSSVPYAWDQPTLKHSLTVTGPGGVCEHYDLNRLGPGTGLTYENFIYIAFAGTFKTSNMGNFFDVENQELVLDVIQTNQVILGRKRHGQRSQLWRMTKEGFLQHEGSSPPSHSQRSMKLSNMLVLDIDNTAPQPNTYSKLTLRRVDPRRRSTQTWRFADGRLRCAHWNMCVQPEDGFFGLREGNSVVLGLPQPVSHQFTDDSIPFEQAITCQYLRPGSGQLSVTIEMDGPTAVVVIEDKMHKQQDGENSERDLVNSVGKSESDLSFDKTLEKGVCKELQLIVNLSGLGVSIVSQKTSEELLYASFTKIIGETVMTPTSKQFCVSIGDIQFDNQLLEAPVPVVLYVTPPGARTSDGASEKLPAIDFHAEMQQEATANAVIFKHLILRLKKFTIILEEKLLLKLCDFVGYNSQEEELLNKDENDYEVQRLLLEVSAVQVKRYYFGIIQLIPDQIRLSVKTATKISPRLQKLKRRLGLTLIKFEDAAVDLSAFERRHPFEPAQILLNSIMKHFKDELIWQAAIILGSVDFLGNPVGLVNDVSEGFSGLFLEGNVKALVKNVTHGLSNSTVKVTESISDGLGRAVLDDDHEEMRQKIRQVESGRGRDHIVAGFKGLGFGILGGATGLFKQIYEGASSDGLPGVVSGLGKGLVGVVTKPVVGVLDFASETARAVRDSSRSKKVPQRTRLPRVIHGIGGLLPRYSFKQSQGQQYLYVVNDKNYKEYLVAYEMLGSGSEDLHCIVSNLKLRIVASTDTHSLAPVFECHLSDLEICTFLTEKDTSSEGRFYIEIVMRVMGTAAAVVNIDPVKRPKIRCKSAELAKSVTHQINYTKMLYYEQMHTVISDNIIISED